MIRCVLCGSSKMDSQGTGCALCGGSPAVRWEQVHISGQTKTKLLAHADELKRFGITVEISQPVQKSSDQIGFTTTDLICVSLAVGDSLHHGILLSIILFLRDLAIPKVEILSLRLDEPETISEILQEPTPAKKPSRPARRKPAKSSKKKGTARRKPTAKKSKKQSAKDAKHSSKRSKKR
jgi:hypothetical protein